MNIPTDVIVAFLAGIPVWGVLGFIFSRVSGPVFDEYGKLFKEWWLLKTGHSEYEVFVTIEEIQTELLSLHNKYGHSAFNERFPFLNSSTITKIKARHSNSYLKTVTQTWAEQVRVQSFQQADIYFAGLLSLSDFLTKNDLEKVYSKHKKNDQAGRLWVFFEQIEQKKPDILSADHVIFLRRKQEDWREILDRRNSKA